MAEVKAEVKKQKGRPPEKKLVYIVRIAGVDIKGEASLLYGFTKIKGINYMLANALCNLLSFDKTKKISELSEKDIELVENTIKVLNKKVPLWLINRRKDPITGDDLHLSSTDVKYAEEEDKKTMKKIKCYRGVRHMHRLTCRGQRESSNHRKNKAKQRRSKK